MPQRQHRGYKQRKAGHKKQLTGTIEEVKDFMFIVTDQDGASYEFDFDEVPEGLDGVSAGDCDLYRYGI